MSSDKKIICLTGGVYSSLGKGIILASIGRILSEMGYKVSLLKLDPYLNINSGFLSPNEHGEVFVTHDGEETDLDLGHYERFLDIEISKKSCYTAGKIYKKLLDRELDGAATGKTIQVIPDVINTIHEVIFELIKSEPNSDFVLIEVGGTIGDIESIPFITAAKHLIPVIKRENILFMHAVPNIYLKNTGEYKSKPAQHSIACLLNYGITPDFLVLTSDGEVSDEIKQKLSNNTTIPLDNIVVSTFQESIYTVPNELFKKKMHEKILDFFSLPKPNKCLKNWEIFTDKIASKKSKKLRLCIVGKYAHSSDAYISIVESFKFAAIEKGIDLEIVQLSSDETTNLDVLKAFNLICVPHGFGTRGVEGKISAIKYARENKIPLLGICFGMQLVLIEYARNVLKLENANSVEIDPKTPHPIIVAQNVLNKMRLGKNVINISPGTQAMNIFGKDKIHSRHRHRYTFNMEYKKHFDDGNLLFSGISGVNEWNILEIVELKDHPFFVASQFHPEFDSRPLKTNPLFVKILEAC